MSIYYINAILVGVDCDDECVVYNGYYDLIDMSIILYRCHSGWLFTAMG